MKRFLQSLIVVLLLSTSITNTNQSIANSSNETLSRTTEITEEVIPAYDDDPGHVF